ncbi:MAG TPA: YlmC/YmxH family sporulation protein [Candidatus Onthocola gallistercoris]|uniref:YlmC/YmxH family sporulation protein n=1 Tax=Candidatus Onthocola gallistercoris TaxID=2840876 RepID=A0A9D1HF82_9FIRM|nr:YlmC/YmxH family sporulation protein [Candidatus Onthocola gallistercoris]
MRICELRQKEVINIRDCQRIGYVMDIDMDPVTGRVCQLIVPGQGKICGLFGRDTEYVIGWKCVRQIGADIILVDVCIEEVLRECEIKKNC